MENTAELVLCLAALTLPPGHGPLPPGWGVAVGTNHGHFCARFVLQQTGQTEKFRAMNCWLQGLLTGLCSLGCRGVVLPLERRDAGLWGSSRRRPGERPGLPGSDGGSWGENSSVGNRNPSV